MADVIPFMSQAEKIVKNAEEMLDELKANMGMGGGGASFALSEVYIDHYCAIEALAKDISFSHQQHLANVISETRKLIIGSSIEKLFKSAVSIKKQTLEAVKRSKATENRVKRLKFDEIEPGEYFHYDPKTLFPMPTVINAQLAFRTLGVTAAIDRMTEKQTFLLNGEALSVPKIRNILFDETGMDFPEKVLTPAIDSYCARFEYHPIKDWLESIEDMPSTGAIENWLSVTLGAEISELNNQIGKKMLVAMVARIYEPGAKFDQMIVLESHQGMGKSTLLQILAGEEYFNSGKILTMESKEQMEALKGRWIYESADLVGHGRADTDAVKAFLSQTSDKGRWAYAKEVADHPRTAIIVGTTNKGDYLIDETGNRRTWPVKCSVIPTKAINEGKHTPNEADLDWLRKNRDQLFSEALRLYRENYSLVLERNLWEVVAVQQKERIGDVPGMEFVPNVFCLTAEEGLYIDDRKEVFQLDIRIFTNDLLINVFTVFTGKNASAGRNVKMAMQAYNHIKGAKWEYKKVIKINKIANSGYQMLINNEETYKEVKEAIDERRKARQRASINNQTM